VVKWSDISLKLTDEDGTPFSFSVGLDHIVRRPKSRYRQSQATEQSTLSSALGHLCGAASTMLVVTRVHIPPQMIPVSSVFALHLIYVY
jgi:hypothetical protein